MQFQTSPTGAIFEIPDDWWSFAEMNAFSPGGGGYYPYDPRWNTQDVEVVYLSDIEPPTRNSRVPPFKKYKLVPVLLAFRSPECALPPVEVQPFRGSRSYRFSVINGYHRYYASVAAGYNKLPIIVRPSFDTTV